MVKLPAYAREDTIKRAARKRKAGGGEQMELL